MSAWRIAMVVLVAVVWMAGCGRRPAPVVSAPSSRLPYLELQPAWRLRIISPLSSAPIGELAMERVVESPDSGASRALTIEAKAPEDFGYLEGWVLLRGRRGGVEFRPDGALQIQGGLTQKVELPARLRGLFPAGHGLARIVFLTREASVDHDMAILQAATPALLSALTDRVLSDPANGCRVAGATWCAWVPKGVAIRVEKRSAGAGIGEWVPVL